MTARIGHCPLRAYDEKLRIGIIGAGTAGLATGIAFTRNGHSVQVFEKHRSLAILGAGVLIQAQGTA